MPSKQKAEQNGKQQQSSFTLSREPNKAMQEMMDTIDFLRDIYVEETQALEAADTKTFFRLQNTKIDAANRYENGVKQIMSRQSEMKKADPRLKIKLKEMQADFTELAQKNIQALQRMQRCTERLGHTLRHAATETAKAKRSLSYGETGIMNSSERKSLSMGVSETA